MTIEMSMMTTTMAMTGRSVLYAGRFVPITSIGDKGFGDSSIKRNRYIKYLYLLYIHSISISKQEDVKKQRN